MVSSILVFLKGDAPALQGYVAALRAGVPGLDVAGTADEDEARRCLPKVDGLVAFGNALPRGILREASRLKFIHSLATGLDGIVDQPDLAPDVIVTATREIHGAPMSELAILFMLALLREFPRTLAAQQRHAWERWRVKTLAGRTVGLVGTGLIAAALASRCAALDMRVVAWSRTPRPLPHVDAVYPLAELAARAAEADFLVLLLPYSPDVHQIVDARVLAAMKPDAYLLNLARGGVLDEHALLEALHTHRIAGAALDVMQREPLPPEHPFWSLDNLILTPHIGGYYDGYVRDASRQICHNLRCLREGRVADLWHRAR